MLPQIAGVWLGHVKQKQQALMLVSTFAVALDMEAHAKSGVSRLSAKARLSALDLEEHTKLRTISTFRNVIILLQTHVPDSRIEHETPQMQQLSSVYRPDARVYAHHHELQMLYSSRQGTGYLSRVRGRNVKKWPLPYPRKP